MGFGNWLFGWGDDARAAAAQRPENFRLEGGDMLRGYAQQQMMGAQGRTAPTVTAAQLAGGPQDQVRAQQMGLLNRMAAVERGDQAGAGELAVNRQAATARGNQFGMAAMARGANAGMAARAGARALGDLGVNAAGMAQQAAAGDQAAARSAMIGLADSTRGQDLSFAGQNANLMQQAGLANASNTLAQRGMNDQYGLGLMGQYANISDAELRARMARAGILQQQAQGSGFAGDLLQAGGTMGAAYLGRPR